MDTSETYIKMCEKSPLQPDLQPWHMMESHKDLFYDFGDVWYAYSVGEGKDMVLIKVKLFTQDQLQEMVKGQHESTWLLIARLWEWWSVREVPARNVSMEQLWLAFVMKEKYNKTWDGEKWSNW